MDASSYPSADLNRLSLSHKVFNLLSCDLMKRYQLIPFEIHNDRLSLAMAEPENEAAKKKIQAITGYELDVFIAPGETILKTIAAAAAKLTPPRCPDLDVEPSDGEAPIVRVVNKVIALALEHRSSDIHLEPQAQGLYVRFRVDGSLETFHKFDKSVSLAIVSRIKIMAEMDIAEKRLPQDGQIRTRVGTRLMDMRISVLPGKYGEKVVIRLLDKSVAAVDLGQMGMDPETQSRFETLIDRPQGIILVTGPTGSGKSTTLYAALGRLRSPLKNIVTLEDPIEYELLPEGVDEAGVTQVQINSKIGLTFAAGLRASLRQDPDIIMVGEIRDKETAEVAMKSAMTGHLVFSTLHTNSAPETIGRLRDIGMESYLIASTLTGIMAQRLLRVLCEKCKEPYTPPAAVLKKWFSGREIGACTLYRPKGCSACFGSGYRGRRGIYELLVMTEEMRALVHAQSPVNEIKKLSREQGCRSLRESGLDFVFRGETTVEEVFRSTVE